jgi:hypothetical protein
MLAEKFMLFLETIISHAEPRIIRSGSPHVPIESQEQPSSRRADYLRERQSGTPQR